MEVLKTLLDWFGSALISLPLTAAFLWLADRSRFRRKWFWVILFVLYLNALFVITGVPDIAHLRWNPNINLAPFSNHSALIRRQMVLNTLLFVPFGGFITLYFSAFRDWKRTLAAGFLLSLLIEALQLAAPRATDIDDLITNTVGTVIGYGIAKILFRHSPKQETSWDWGRLAAMVLLTLLTVMLARRPLMDALYNVI